MLSFFKPRYTSSEQQLLDYIQQTLSVSGLSSWLSSTGAKKILDSAIEEAKELGIYQQLGAGLSRLERPNYLKNRIEAGLTEGDVREYLNLDPVYILSMEKLTNAIRLGVFKELIDQGKTSAEAVKTLRGVYIYYGDPEVSHENFQNEDADIYHEFARRYEAWRSRTDIVTENELAKDYSTYNAMVRDLIRKGQI